MVKLTKEQKNTIINELDEFSKVYNAYEYGLPTHNEANMAKMREIIGEILED